MRFQPGKEGLFNLTLSSAVPVLVVKYIGKQVQEVPVNGQTEFTIALKDDETSVGEVLVIGYGTQSRETLTTSVSKLDKRCWKMYPWPMRLLLCRNIARCARAKHLRTTGCYTTGNRAWRYLHQQSEWRNAIVYCGWYHSR